MVTREKERKGKRPPGGERETGVRRGKGERGRRRGAPTALNAPRRRRPLSRCPDPLRLGAPGALLYRDVNKARDHGPETIRVCVCVCARAPLYNAVSFILPRLVIQPVNERVSREHIYVLYDCVPTCMYI